MARTPARQPRMIWADIHGPRFGPHAVSVGDQSRDLPYARPHQAVLHPVHSAHQWAERTLAAIGGEHPFW